jgi:hypothetical protein
VHSAGSTVRLAMRGTSERFTPVLSGGGATPGRKRTPFRYRVVAVAVASSAGAASFRAGVAAGVPALR